LNAFKVSMLSLKPLSGCNDIEGERACLPGVNPNPNKTGANRRPPVLTGALVRNSHTADSHSKTARKCNFDRQLWLHSINRSQNLRADENRFSCQSTVIQMSKRNRERASAVLPHSKTPGFFI